MSEKKSYGVEMLALGQVPKEERQHWSSVTIILAGGMVSVNSLLIGSLMVSGMPLSQSIFVGIIGFLLVVLLMVFQGMQGADLGVPSVVAATSAFGDKGSQWLLSGLFAATTIGYFAIMASICGSTFAELLDGQFGIALPVKVSIVLWGLIMSATAVWGFNGLKYLNMIGLPLMCVICAYGIYLGISQHGLSALGTYVPGSVMTISEGISMLLGGYAVSAAAAADFTRYQKNRPDVVVSSVIGVLPAGIALLAAGAVLAIVAGTDDLIAIFVSLGIPILGLVALIFSSWPVNTGNAYSAGLDTVKMFKLSDPKRIHATMACGTIGTLIGSFEIVSYFQTIVTYFGIVIMPVAGVMIADYWVMGKGKPENWRPRAGLHYAGIVSWASGVAISLVVEAGIPPLNGIVVSFLIYILWKGVYSSRDALVEQKEL